VKGATVVKLVERLTFEKYPGKYLAKYLHSVPSALTSRYADPDYLQSFLLTYRSFVSPTDLFEMLKVRFNWLPRKESEIEDFKKNKQMPIRLRY
jgi:hypothetical protein